jgi:hypothetical protein
LFQRGFDSAVLAKGSQAQIGAMLQHGRVPAKKSSLALHCRLRGALGRPSAVTAANSRCCKPGQESRRGALS